MTTRRIPVLLGEPILLPAGLGGDWAGAAVRFDLGRVREWDYEGPVITRPDLEAQKELSARREQLPPDDDDSEQARDIRTDFNRDQRKANRRWPARWCAYLVYDFIGGNDLPTEPCPLEDWEQFPADIVRWLQTEGLAIAVAQVKAPFTNSDPSFSSSTDE